MHGAGHSWLLKDPETLPAIVEDLLQDRLGVAIRGALSAAGLSAAGAEGLAELEEACYEPDAKILALTPALDWTPSGETYPEPWYDWTVSEPS